VAVRGGVGIVRDGLLGLGAGSFGPEAPLVGT
jgi:hypothetical protein